MNSDQRLILVGMVAAVVFSALFVFGGQLLLGSSDLTIALPGDRIAYALGCDFWAGLALLAGVARVAGQRFFSNEVDGSLPAEERTLQVNRAYIQNTSEQLLLLLVAHAGLSQVLPAESLSTIPLLVALFLVGRITFWLGYRHSPPARAFGFATTFYPTVAVFLYVGFRLVWG